MIQGNDEREHLTRLLTQAGNGDQQAFAQVYQITSSTLFGMCLRMLRDRSDAEEVLQEIYTTVWLRAKSFDAKRASAFTWLAALTRNKAIDRLRQHRESLLEDPVDLDQVIDEQQPTPAGNAQRSQDYQRLQRCLEMLEAKQRHAVREAFFSGATYNELAARCKVPLGTMKSWIRRSLLQLRTCLES
ncbi:RNA polymerase sigma factor [Dyella lipolytica]|uniref:Sigma-70 family RNA polymerase sigma factor n=1 Tax=Dyella lipolytica TaxID=1867835 RepID=A0ABW8IXT1_9GAMM|nr:sigma-70 family RNA polymerase sigma factor [Dyella lipolytica]GLQ45951.1 RNA polymerase sigma factor [Dyella lipolytica]